MSIEKYMDTSTCYITEKDNKQLNKWDVPLACYPYEEGYFIYCGSMDSELAAELSDYGMSQDFINLLQFAQGQGCWFLRLDCDGDDSYDFPKHEW